MRERKHMEVADSLQALDIAEWNALERGDFLFADYRFLKALEDGGCLGRRTGWHPQFLLLYDGPKGNEQLQAALILYLKTNSYGEFIFDWAWANAVQSQGLPYYPKLTAAIPFTPASGPKFLFRAGLTVDEKENYGLELINGARALMDETGATSLHLLFVTDEEAKTLAGENFNVRHSFQYHWKNQGWKDFEEFLRALRSKRRSEIRRERAAVAQLPLKIRTLTGAALDEYANLSSIIYGFYKSQILKMGGHAYLTPSFFDRLFQEMKENCVVVLAENMTGVPVAASFNLREGKTLYGRYWGCLEDYRNLHFEVCYYQTIEWAIANGVELFEAGAQGEHKFNRGFTPELTLSAHDLSSLGDERLEDAIASFIEEEKHSVSELFEEYRAHDPFKRGDA